MLISVNMIWIICEYFQFNYNQINMETNRPQMVLETLQRLNNCSSNAEIAGITRILSEEMNKQGYVLILAAIIKCPQVGEAVIFAALTQLKNTLRAKWNNSKAYLQGQKILSNEDRHGLVKELLEMNIANSHNYTSFKLVKDICQFVGEGLIELVPTILQLLQNGQELKSCLNILLALAHNYRYESQFDKKAEFYRVLKYIMPVVYNLVHVGEQKLTSLYWNWHNHQTTDSLQTYNQEKEHFEEILYMSIKFACRTISNYLPLEIRPLYNLWAAIAQNRLDQQNETYSQNAKVNPLSCGNKGTDEFNYFHGRKWAAKYLANFFSRVLVNKKSQPELSKITTQYYEQYGESLKETLHRMFQRDQPTTVRYYELALLESLLQRRSKLLKAEFEYYLFQILPNLIIPTAQDLENIKDNPFQFLMSESCKDKNIKASAKSLWCMFALFDSEEVNHHNNKPPVQGNIIIHCFAKFKQWLLDQSWEKKSVALELMNHLGHNVVYYQQSMKMAKEMIDLCIPNIFYQPLMILKIRGFQMIHNYPRAIDVDTYNTLQQVILQVLKERNRKKIDLLAIYAGKALDKVILYGKDTIRGFTGEEIQLILSTLLELIKLYEADDLTETISTMIQEYPQEMNCYCVELVKYLSSTLKEMIEKAVQNNQSSQVPSNIVSLLITLIRFDVKDETFNAVLKQTLQKEIAQLLDLVITCEEQLNTQYLDEILSLLNALLNSKTNEVAVLSDRLNFYFVVLVFRIAPLKSSIRESMKRSTLTSKQQQIIEISQKYDCLDTQTLFQLFRNYLKFIAPQSMTFHLKVEQIIKDYFGANLLDQFYYLAFFYYKDIKNFKGENDFFNCIRGRYIVTSIFICVIEHHQRTLPDHFYLKTLQIIIVNHRTNHFRRYLIRKNLELFCMWIWGCQRPIGMANACNVMIPHLIAEFMKKLNCLKRDNRFRKRVMIGFCRIIELSSVHQELKALNSILVQWLFSLAAEYLRYGRNVEDEESYEGEQDDYEENVPSHSLGQNNDEAEDDNTNLSSSFNYKTIFEKNCDFENQIDEENQQEYQQMRTINHIDYFLNILAYLKSSKPQNYVTHILEPKFTQIHKILTSLDVARSEEYGHLLKP